MAELLKQYKDVIINYHEHDSLLENKEDEDLTEEERKAAWKDYEEEKNRPALAAQARIASNGEFDWFSFYWSIGFAVVETVLIQRSGRVLFSLIGSNLS